MTDVGSDVPENVEGRLTVPREVEVKVVTFNFGVNSRRQVPQFPDSHCAHLGSLWLPRWLSGKESACQCRRCRFNPWVGKVPWRRKATPVFLPRKSHGQRRLQPMGSQKSQTRLSNWTAAVRLWLLQHEVLSDVWGGCASGFAPLPGAALVVLGLLCCFCCSVTKSYLTLCSSTDCNVPGFPVLGDSHHSQNFQGLERAHLWRKPGAEAVAGRSATCSSAQAVSHSGHTRFS